MIAGATLLMISMRKSKESVTSKIDYRAFYILGIVFLPLGIVYIAISFSTNFPFALAIPFIGIGGSYLAIGLANKDKWEESD